LEQVDTPRRIYEAPQTTFVAGFFGSPPMNLIDVERDGDGLRAGAFTLPAPSGGAAKLVLGIRPEHLRVGGAAAGLAINAEARVGLAEPHGSETHLELAVGSITLRAKVSGFDAPPIDERVRVGFSLEHVRWFDGDTGKAL
jgi:ABC-type sugar transport system ATPase subunit